jgi:hypothetical protein
MRDNFSSRTSTASLASYADAKGDSEKQLQLTKARLAVVREYLAQHFKLDDTRLKAIGLRQIERHPGRRHSRGAGISGSNCGSGTENTAT